MQTRYSKYNSKLETINSAIKILKYLIEDRKLVVITHCIVYAFKQKSEKTSLRQLRHLANISQFRVEIMHTETNCQSRIDSIGTSASFAA